MPDIRIHREHKLGLAEARKIAGEWACEVESRFGMACSTIQGETSDTVEFTRSGVKGRLIVAADHFDLDAKLGKKGIIFVSECLSHWQPPASCGQGRPRLQPCASPRHRGT